jgi:hypothetical protein
MNVQDARVVAGVKSIVIASGFYEKNYLVTAELQHQRTIFDAARSMG